MKNWEGQRILILGAARQGLALARYAAQRGAIVTLNDQRAAELMEEARQSLADLSIEWILGEHPLEVLDRTDLLCVSGGVPLTLPIIVEAQKRGIPLTNDSQIFMEEVLCRVIGITGSAGKTTTTTLVGRMAQAAVKAPRRVWVGGNIGMPLIDQVQEIQPDDLVILELSSFQLELMATSPQVAAVLNITPNHLDRHGTMQAYTAAKANILKFQQSSDIAVLGHEDAGAWSLSDEVKGKLIVFGFERSRAGLRGTYLNGDQLSLFDGNETLPIMKTSDIQLRGRHNILNVLAACAIAYAAGLPVEAMSAGVQDFHGVAHRLEFVREINGVKWYNDSIATAPERTAAALRSFREPLVLLLGGRDKALPWEKLAELIHERVDHVILFGEAAAKIKAAIGPLSDTQRPFSIRECTGLQEAVHAAYQTAQPGNVVLLSPGGTSFDEFKDFEERGERFRLWVNQLS